jgi:hypothetical protein
MVNSYFWKTQAVVKKTEMIGHRVERKADVVLRNCQEGTRGKAVNQMATKQMMVPRASAQEVKNLRKLGNLRKNSTRCKFFCTTLTSIEIQNP